jgi:hypothetical protein
MPDFMDDLLGDSGEPGEDDGAPEQDPSAPPKEPKSTDKRISDLQSARDKETARANKAEAKLKALLAVDAGDAGDTDRQSAPAGGSTESAILEMARMFAVQQNPKLAEYGLSERDLVGNSPSEISRSAADLIARFEKIETQVRNKVLAANGLAPELDGTAVPTPDRDFSKMSSEDFKKIMDAAMQGRM